MKNKFLLIALAGVLVIFIGLIVYLAKTGKIKPSAEVAGPSLTLSPGSQTVAVDQTFNVNIIVDTAGLEADGVDVFHLHYDPAVLEVQDADTTSVGVQIQKGSIFPMWPANSVNTSSGEISISGIVNVGQDLPGYVSSPGNDVFATITFKALAPATTTTLHFDATPGYTTDSNISEHGGTGVDLLVSAPDGNYTVTGAETPRHKECNTTSQTCVTVDGAGADRCTSDSDCQPQQSHSICNTSNQTCETVAGAGANQCATNADCQTSSEHHYICEPTKKVCIQVSGAGSNQCVSSADCNIAPTPPPTAVPTAEPTIEPTPPINGPVTTPEPIAFVTPQSQTPIPTMTGSIIPLSPTPEVSPTPTGIGEIVIAGQAMSRTVFIILLIGIAAVLTIVAIYIWDWRKKKGAFSGEDTSASDDEEI